MKRERLFYTALACVVVPAIALLSFIPEGDKQALHSNGRFHSAGHFVVFALAGFVAGRTSRSLWMRLLLFAGLLLFGFGIEAAEHLNYDSAMEWTDVVVDGLGVAAGTLLASVSVGWNR